jgi:hypothetical protein
MPSRRRFRHKPDKSKECRGYRIYVWSWRYYNLSSLGYAISRYALNVPSPATRALAV